MIKSTRVVSKKCGRFLSIFYLSLISWLLLQNTHVYSNELSQVIGESVGQDQSLALPTGAALSHFNIYFNHDGQQSEITGIQLVYAFTAGDGGLISSALVGSKGSKSARYMAGDKGGFRLDTFEFEQSAVAGKPLSSLMIKNGFYGTGWGISGAGGQKVVKKLEESQEFGGLIVRTDGQKIYGLGVIVKGQASIALNQQSSSSQADNPFAEPDNPFTEPENPFAGTTQTPIARRPGDTRSESGGSTRMAVDEIPDDQLFVDYWVEAATGVTHPNPPPKKNSKEYAYWENRFISPLTIKVQKGSPGSIIIENVNGRLDNSTNKENEYERAPTVGHGTLVLHQVNDKTYASGSMKAILKRGAHSGEDLLFLQVPEPWDFLSRTYERAKLPFNLSLSSNRFTAEQQGRRTDRDDSFSTVVKLYQPSLHGYDPSLIDPLEPGAGVKKQLFASSDLKEYSFDNDVSKGVPYGLKGYNLLKSSNTVRSISTSSEVQAQEETSRSMGTNVVGFGANFAEEFVTSSRKNTSVSTTLSLLKAYSYALLQDFPNGKLHFFFRNQIETLIEQPNSSDLAPYEKIVENFGTHYANAITYGGMAYNESTTSKRETAQSLVEKWNSSLSGEANGTSGNLGSGEGQTDSSTTRLEQTEKNWTSIGGSGAFNEGGFQVNDDKLMPVAYDFRPISELVNVVFFPTDGEQKKIRRVLEVRQMLGHAINKKLNSLPVLSRETRPTSKAYRLNVSSIKCTHGNELDRSKLQLSGRFDLKVTDSLDTRTENIFNVPIVERERVQVVKLDCGSNAVEHEINRDFILVNSVERPSEPTFELSVSDLYSYVKPTYTSEDKAALNPFLRDVVSPVGETILGLFVGREETKTDLNIEYRDILLKASHKLVPRTDQKRGVTSAELYPGPQNGIIIYGSQGKGGGNIWVKYTIEKLQ